MLEELCKDSFYNACSEIVARERVRLIRDNTPRKYIDFFTASGTFSYNWHVIPLASVFNGRRDGVRLTRMKAWHYMIDHSDQLRDHYLRVAFQSDLEMAMSKSGSFEVLFQGFTDYYEGRRRSFMEKTDAAIEAKKTALAAIGQRPQSHGGVANLLKVLTKTMHDQGSSIYSIAKVQYAICMQAGIYIPDEFLTDVLVTGEMVREG